jgi:sigma-B regulation protein RsbU (phosphoserine phosphatase)
MESYLDQAPCFYFTSTEDGTITEVNQMLCSYLGFSKSELLKQKVDIIFTLATRIFYQTHFFPLVKIQGHVNEIFITLQSKSKDHIPVLMNAERREVEGIQLLVHIGILVLNRKKFEDELIAAKKAAETALNENTALIQAKESLQQHMEQMDRHLEQLAKQNVELKQFNRVVTHDLQEPLRKITVFVNMMQNHQGKEPPQHTIERLLRVTEQMRSIVAGLQQYVWLTESVMKPEQVDLTKILLVVQKQVQQEFDPVSLVIEATDLPEVYGDRDQLQMLIYHVLANAARFRRDESTAFVKVSATSLQMNSFRNIEGKYNYSEFIRIELRDNGIGFDPLYKDQVFELFRRLHPESGRGIGLSLCKKIMENHHGQISISTKPGAGTSIILLLPAQTAGAAIKKGNTEKFIE